MFVGGLAGVLHLYFLLDNSGHLAVRPNLFVLPCTKTLYRITSSSACTTPLHAHANQKELSHGEACID